MSDFDRILAHLLDGVTTGRPLPVGLSAKCPLPSSFLTRLAMTLLSAVEVPTDLVFEPRRMRASMGALMRLSVIPALLKQAATMDDPSSVREVVESETDRVADRLLRLLRALDYEMNATCRMDQSILPLNDDWCDVPTGTVVNSAVKVPLTDAVVEVAVVVGGAAASPSEIALFMKDVCNSSEITTHHQKSTRVIMPQMKAETTGEFQIDPTSAPSSDIPEQADSTSTSHIRLYESVRQHFRLSHHIGPLEVWVRTVADVHTAKAAPLAALSSTRLRTIGRKMCVCWDQFCSSRPAMSQILTTNRRSLLYARYLKSKSSAISSNDLSSSPSSNWSSVAKIEKRKKDGPLRLKCKSVIKINCSYVTRKNKILREKKANEVNEGHPDLPVELFDLKENSSPLRSVRFTSSQKLQISKWVEEWIDSQLDRISEAFHQTSLITSWMRQAKSGNSKFSASDFFFLNILTASIETFHHISSTLRSEGWKRMGDACETLLVKVEALLRTIPSSLCISESIRQTFGSSLQNRIDGLNSFCTSLKTAINKAIGDKTPFNWRQFSNEDSDSTRGSSSFPHQFRRVLFVSGPPAVFNSDSAVLGDVRLSYHQHHLNLHGITALCCVPSAGRLEAWETKKQKVNLHEQSVKGVTLERHLPSIPNGKISLLLIFYLL